MKWFGYHLEFDLKYRITNIKSMHYFIILLILTISLQTYSFHQTNVRLKKSSYQSKHQKSPQLQAEGGLNPETLDALGNIQDSSDSIDSIAQAATPVGSVLTKVVASPIILAVPIGAGLLVAFGIGFFIFWYGKGND